MSRLEELIQQYCPDGVEWKPLGEVCKKVFAGGTPTSSNGAYYDGDIPWLRSGEVNFNEIKHTEKTITEEGYNSSSAKWIEKHSVLIAMTGATVARSAMAMIDLTANQSVCALTPKRDILYYRFLYYWISKSYLQLKGMAQGALTSLNLNIIKNLEIPVPPLPVQEEIVRILDTFTELQAELQAELQKRLQQYNFYRDNLLSFEGRTDVEYKEYTLGDLFEFKNGLNASKDQFGHGIPIVNYVNVYKKNSIISSDLSGKVELDKSSIDRYRVKRGDVFFTRTSETKEEIGIASVLLEDIEDCVFSGFVLRARPITDILLPEFCKYCFSTYNTRKQIIQSSTLTTRALTNGTSLSKVKVNIPSKSEQQRIVDILDRFDALTTDITAGLPAEIEARRKQYEYYRDTLLTFKKK